MNNTNTKGIIRTTFTCTCIHVCNCYYSIIYTLAMCLGNLPTAGKRARQFNNNKL